MPTKSQTKVTPDKKSKKAAVSQKDTPKKSGKKNVSQSPKKKLEPKANPAISNETKSKSSAKSKKNKKSETPKSQDKKVEKASKSSKSTESKISKKLQKKRASVENSQSKIIDLSQVVKQVKPKRVISPFIQFCNQNRAQVMSSTKDTKKKLPDSSKILGQMWQSLNLKEKKPYIQMSEQDKKRFEREKSDLEKIGYFTDANGVKSTDLLLQNPKFYNHVVKPKIFLRPFNLFYKQSYNTLKNQNPSLKVTEMIKLAHQLWNKLTDSQKSFYYDLSSKDKIRYQNQIKDLVTKGYFINEKGEKSCDLKPRRKYIKQISSSQSTKTGSTAENLNSQNSQVKPVKIGEKRKRVASTPEQKKSGKTQKFN